MGRKKQEEIVETIENLEAEVVDEVEAVEEELSLDSESAPEPKRQRRSRKTAEVEVAAEAVEEAVVEEAPVEEEKPKRQSRRSKKQADTPEAQIELAAEAMRKSMDEMVSQWEKIQEITGIVSSQLEKVSHIVKPAVQDFVDTQDMVRPHNPKSQFITRFATVASIVAVLCSLVSLSLSQSARQVVLNAEATRVANSQLFQNRPSQPAEVAVVPVENRAVKRTNDVFAPPRVQRAYPKFRK